MKVTEIKLEGEGHQLLSKLKEKYNLSKHELIKFYAEKIGLYPNTLRQYLKNKIVTNDKFKKQIEEEFSTAYENIVQTIEFQLKHYVEVIRDNIEIYNSLEDTAMLESLVAFTKNYGFPYLELIALGNLCRHKHNLRPRQNNEAKKLMIDIINQSKSKGFKDLEVYYKLNLAYIENTDENYKCAKKILKGVEINETIPITIIYRYWYTYGITLEYLQQYAAARKMFKESINFATQGVEKIKSTINIALTFKLEGKYKSALKWYEAAYNLCDDDTELQCIILNNMATTYAESNDLKNARICINRAVEIMPINMRISRKINVYDTFLSLENDLDGMIEEIIQCLAYSDQAIDNRRFIMSCIDKFIDRLKEKEKIEDLKELARKLKFIINRGEGEQIYIEASFARIIIFLIEKGELYL